MFDTGLNILVISACVSVMVITAECDVEYLNCHSGHVLSVNNDTMVTELNETLCGNLSEQSCVRATSVIDVQVGVEVKIVIYGCLANEEVSAYSCDELTQMFENLGFYEEHGDSKYESCEFQLCNTTLCNGTYVEDIVEPEGGGNPENRLNTFIIFFALLTYFII